MTRGAAFKSVFDTNVIIAVLKSKNPASPTVELLHRWRRGEFDLLYADELLLEYQEKLVTRNVAPSLRVAFLADLDAWGQRIELLPGQIPPLVPDDPDDDVVLACALIGKTTHLVTYDPHLLKLGEVYQGISDCPRITSAFSFVVAASAAWRLKSLLRTYFWTITKYLGWPPLSLRRSRR